MELARVLEPLTCCFSAASIGGLWPGWHRLESGLVRPRKDTHCLRSSSDRWAGKCGGKCGVIVYVSVTFMDAMTPFRVSDL
jgi:hypothetical protein